MYNIYTTKIKDLVDRLKSKGNFDSLSHKQKKVFASEIESIEIINAREVFMLFLILFVWYKSYIYCLITLKSGEKLAIDVSKKDINTYLGDFI